MRTRRKGRRAKTRIELVKGRGLLKQVERYCWVACLGQPLQLHPPPPFSSVLLHILVNFVFVAVVVSVDRSRRCLSGDFPARASASCHAPSRRHNDYVARRLEVLIALTRGGSPACLVTRNVLSLSRIDEATSINHTAIIKSPDSTDLPSPLCLCHLLVHLVGTSLHFYGLSWLSARVLLVQAQTGEISRI